MNLIMHSRMEYFKIDLHFVKDYVQQNWIRLVRLPTKFQVVDILTKLVSGTSFSDFQYKL